MLMKPIRSAALTLVLFAAPTSSLADTPPAQWHDNDWIKFADSAVAIALGEAATAVGGVVPIVDVYSALSAVGGATRTGLDAHLRKKAADALSAGDDERFDRYNAFLVCLRHSSCEMLKQLLAENEKKPAPASGVLVASLIVPNDKPEKVTTDIVLEKGRKYRIRASGEVSDWENKTGGVDAVWCYAEWRCGKTGLPWNQLRIDGKGMTDIAGKKIPYNSSHEYEVEYEGQGRRLVFHMYDAMSSSSNNTGSIYVDIYR